MNRISFPFGLSSGVALVKDGTNAYKKRCEKDRKFDRRAVLNDDCIRRSRQHEKLLREAHEPDWQGILFRHAYNMNMFG